jgi:hypothetical protein
MQPDEFLVTQGFLATMLGVQRTGLIRYKYGNGTILDRRGLIRRSCEYYGVSKKEFDRLLGDRAIRKTHWRGGPAGGVRGRHARRVVVCGLA